jgi:L-ascorbate metabolism protein UlaG (beta-lactamase superfamily)
LKNSSPHATRPRANNNRTKSRTMNRRRWLRGLTGAGATGTAVWLGKNTWLSAGPGWKGPRSDHFDGRRFFNPEGPESRGLVDFWRWKLGGGRIDWPASAGGLVEPQVAESVSPGEASVTFVGHATFLIQLPGMNIVTDPVWSDRCSPVSWAGPRRVRPPALEWDRLPRIDIALVSHNHYDHLDIETLRRLEARDQPSIITGLGNRAFLAAHGLHRVVELDWWDERRVRDVRVGFTPAVHWSNRGGWGLNETLWGGFQLAAGPHSIFFAGDTGYGGHFSEIRRRLGAPSLALLPIGAYEPQWFMRALHMHPQDAVRAHHDLGSKRSLGMHFGTWQLTDEGIDHPLDALAAARTAAGISEGDFAAATFGEAFRLA